MTISSNISTDKITSIYYLPKTMLKASDGGVGTFESTARTVTSVTSLYQSSGS